MPKPKTLITGFIAIFVFFSLLTFSLYQLPIEANAQVPKLQLSCSATDSPEFNSVRPYQAAPCGSAPKARFCSNRLVFFEDFNVKGMNDCRPQGVAGSFICHPNFQVQPHNLYVDLDDSQFPIMGNTEDVKNYEKQTDSIDDATKVNEYVSWYLNGVVDKKENTDSTDDQIVNYSGPVRKLLPSMIQDAQRIKTIKTATDKTTYYDEDLKKEVTEADNHDQIVVDSEKLSSWKGDLSFLRSLSNTVLNLVEKIPGVENVIGNVLTEAWNSRMPPLPWDDGKGGIVGGKNTQTGETTIKTHPFNSELEYQKAYNEWRGKSCAIVPVIQKLICIDGPVTNKYADLWRFVPLSNNSDKKGANYLLTDDGPSYDPSEGTAIENAFHEDYTNAPLYFAHTQEVKDLSGLLNSTFTPGKYENQPLPKSVEENTCSNLEVRTNHGDNLFPGDPPEITVTGVQYKITEAKCEEKPPVYDCKPRGPDGTDICKDWPGEFRCNAEVGVILELGTKTPFAKEIFDATVADSGSTFRKIYPKVQENAPVSCIADIPTVSNVTYDASKTLNPPGGEYTFKVQNYPEDGATDAPLLTFPHIGSIYEYFLKGIQTALRPQGLNGEQPISGQNCTNIQCGELPKGLPKTTGSCSLGGISPLVGNIPNSLKEIVSAAAQTYKVPPNLILGIMYGEGLFNKGRFNWTDLNVKNWSTCQKIPNCNESGDDNFMGFNGNDWATVSKGIAGDLKKLDPTRKEPNVCNLLDAVYGVAWNLHDSADGGGGLPKSCFGIGLQASVPTSCTWNDSQYESAIKVSESGYTSQCLTKENSCATGGGLDAACANGDTCETNAVRYVNPSHNACVWDVGHGK